MADPRVLVLAPFAPSDGAPHAGGRFLHAWVTGLAERDLRVSLAVPAAARAQALGRPPAGVHVLGVDVPVPRPGIAGRAGRWLHRSLAGLAPAPGVRRAYATSAALAAQLADAAVLEVQWSEWLPLVAAVRRVRPDLPVAAVVHDVRGRALAERAVSASRRSERWSARLAAPRVAAAEARWLSSCDVAWAFAADPLLETVAPRLGVRLVPPWLELPAAPPGPQPGGPVLFVAAFDRVENVEAARWLVRSVWPAVRGAHAGARLVLAGAHPERVADLAGSDVTLTGYLAELGPLYASAAAVVAPVRGAGGLPFKVPQAMAWALPVVATTLGADPVTADRTLFAAVADDPADFAAGILATLADPARGRAVGAAAQAWVRAAYDLDAALDAAAALYRDLAAGN